MLRINLLPAYIAERRRVNLAIALSTALFLLVTAGGLGYNFGILAGQVKSSQDLDTQEQAAAQKEQAYEAATATMLTQVAPLYDKVNFVDQVRFYNTLPGKIYRNAARYTYRKVEYNAMAVTGNNLALSGTVSSLDDIGRFYLTMFANPDVTAVSFTGVPGYPEVQKQKPVIDPNGPPPTPPQYNIAMNATLISSVVAPTLPASLTGAVGGASAAAGGPSAFGGPSAPIPTSSSAPGAPNPGASGGPPNPTSSSRP